MKCSLHFFSRFVTALMFVALALASVPMPSAQAQENLKLCNKPQTSKEAIVFIDLNASPDEIETAGKAACDRGQSFYVYPGLQYAKDIHPIGLQIDALKKQELTSRCAFEDRDVNTCQTLNSSKEALEDKIIKYKKAHNLNYDADSMSEASLADIDKMFKGINDSGTHVKSIVISGHSGGTEITGYQGLVKLADLLSTIKHYPDATLTLDSFYLWGCYTGEARVISYFKELYPQLKLLSGFTPQAPLNTSSSNTAYLYDVLMKEDKLLDSGNDSALKSAIAGLSSIQNLNVGLYVNGCGTNEKYYARRQDELGVHEYQYQNFDAATACEGFSEILKIYGYDELYKQYFLGDKEIPTETSGTDLRKLYNFARKWEHCNYGIINQNHDRIDASTIPYYVLDADHIGLLLFFNDVKKNYAANFKKELDAVPDHIAAFEKSGKTLFEEPLAKYDGEIQSLQSDIESFSQTKTTAIDELKKHMLVANNESEIAYVKNEMREKVFQKIDSVRDGYQRAELIKDLNKKNARLAERYFKAMDELDDFESKQEDLVTKLSSDLEKKQRDLEQLKSSRDLLQKDYNAYTLAKNDLRAVDFPKTSTIETISRKDILYKDSLMKTALTSISLQKLVQKYPSLKAPIQNLTATEKNFNSYLVEVSSQCMNFLDWHEYNASAPPKPLCNADKN